MPATDHSAGFPYAYDCLVVAVQLSSCPDLTCVICGLQPVHWVGLQDPPPEKYRIHGHRLIRVREPGFVVQGFLWCNSKHESQLDNKYKRAYSLDKAWGDKDTIDIVSGPASAAANGSAYPDAHALLLRCCLAGLVRQGQQGPVCGWHGLLVIRQLDDSHSA